jgi:hypothetical protein
MSTSEDGSESNEDIDGSVDVRDSLGIGGWLS